MFRKRVTPLLTIALAASTWIAAPRALAQGSAVAAGMAGRVAGEP